MSELFDTTQLPDDAEHWDAMARRVVAAVARAQTPSLLEWLASPRIAWLAASIIVAALSILVIWAPEPSPQAMQEWAPAFAPADAAGRVMTVADRPPDIELLLDNQLRSAR